MVRLRQEPLPGPGPAPAGGGQRHGVRRGHPGRHAAGIEYPDIAEGALDFILYWRTLPWDHAPGSLLVAEAGGVSARLDGSPYRPEAPGGEDGLLVAADPECWERTRDILLGR